MKVSPACSSSPLGVLECQSGVPVVPFRHTSGTNEAYWGTVPSPSIRCAGGAVSPLPSSSTRGVPTVEFGELPCPEITQAQIDHAPLHSFNHHSHKWKDPGKVCYAAWVCGWTGSEGRTKAPPRAPLCRCMGSGAAIMPPKVTFQHRQRQQQGRWGGCLR